MAVKSFELELTPEQVEVFGNALAHIVNVEVAHPAIAAPLVAGLESGTPFMAYEYVEGESLDVALRRQARPPEAVAWIAALAGAVDAAHARGLEHGALHLRDVLVSSEGVFATGFGIARALEHVQLDVPVRRPYAAPEVLAGRRWGPPADRFALAVLAYELLTGTRPAGNSDEAVADLRELLPAAADTAGLQQAFRNALADEPSIRSASATAFVTAVARAVGDEGMRMGSGPSAEAVADDPAGLEDTADVRHAVGDGAVDAGDGEPVFGAPEFDSPAGSDPGGSGDEPSRPVQIALPDAAGVRPGDGTAASEDADKDVEEPRGTRRSGSQRASRSKRRSPRGKGKRRRSGPVVAVRDDVHFDPLDDGGAIEPAVSRADYDEDVPPPPSPTSMRAMVPLIAASAVGVLLAWLVVEGWGTFGDDANGGAPQPSENAEVGVAFSEETVGASGEQRPVSAGPLTLVEEPIVQVGDPPGPDAEPDLTGGPPPSTAVAEAAPESDGVPPAADPPPAAPVAEAAPEILPAGVRPVTPVDDAPARPVEARAGSLLVRSRPPGATVRVDDVEVGVTPVELPEVAFGTHQVRIELPGYRPWVTEVDVSGTDQVRVGASLEPGEQ